MDNASLASVRNTGILNPPALPPDPFLDYQPWWVRVQEGDFLLGRRGFAGWNGLPYDPGLYIDAPSWLARWWDDLDWWQRAGILTIGAAAAAGAVVLGGWLGGAALVPLATTAAIGVGVFGVGAFAHQYGGHLQAANGMDDPYAPFLKAAGTVGMVLGGGVILSPVLAPLMAAHPAVPWVAGGAYFGVEAYNAIRYTWSQKTWQEIVERWGPTAAFAGLAAGYGGVRLVRWTFGKGGPWRNFRASRLKQGRQLVRRYHYAPRETVADIVVTGTLEARDLSAPLVGVPKAWVTKITPTEMRGPFAWVHRLRLGFMPSKRMPTPHLRGGRLIWATEDAWVEVRVLRSSLRRAPFWKAPLGGQEFIPGDVRLPSPPMIGEL